MSTKMFYSVSRYVISELPGSFVFVFFIKLPVPSEQTLPKPKVCQATSLQHSVAKHMTNVSIRQPTIRRRIITKCRMNEKDHVNAASIEYLLQIRDGRGRYFFHGAGRGKAKNLRDGAGRGTPPSPQCGAGRGRGQNLRGGEGPMSTSNKKCTPVVG